MTRVSLALLSLLAVTACAPTGPNDLKSPCAGISGSPCERRPVNDWWLGARERADDASGFRRFVG